MQNELAFICRYYHFDLYLQALIWNEQRTHLQSTQQMQKTATENSVGKLFYNMSLCAEFSCPNFFGFAANGP